MHLHYNLMQNVSALASNAIVPQNENTCQCSAMLSLLMGVTVKCNVWPRTVGRGGDSVVLYDSSRQEGSPVVLLTASWQNKLVAKVVPRLLQRSLQRGCADLFIMDSTVATILYSASASSGFWVMVTEYKLAEQLVQAFLDT